MVLLRGKTGNHQENGAEHCQKQPEKRQFVHLRVLQTSRPIGLGFSRRGRLVPISLDSQQTGRVPIIIGRKALQFRGDPVGSRLACELPTFRGKLAQSRGACSDLAHRPLPPPMTGEQYRPVSVRWSIGNYLFPPFPLLDQMRPNSLQLPAACVIGLRVGHLQPFQGLDDDLRHDQGRHTRTAGAGSKNPCRQGWLLPHCKPDIPAMA